MKKLLSLSLGALAGAMLASGAASAAETPAADHAAAAAAHYEIEHQKWSFGGFKGLFDRAQLQRGFQVYREVCAACHGLKRLPFRTLSEPGGPEFPEAAVKELAKGWANKVTDGPDDTGKMFERAPLPSDTILGPYKNDKEARAAQNGALPPDLSIIAKARGVHRDPHWAIHGFLMLGDIVSAYQEGGPDYIYALMTGYKDAPADVKVADGMQYNLAFPGNQISMPPPLSDGVVIYQDGTPGTLDNYARDVAAFLAWSADPSLNQRKRIGWQVILYMLVTTALLFAAKKRVWAGIKH